MTSGSFSWYHSTVEGCYAAGLVAGGVHSGVVFQAFGIQAFQIPTGSMPRRFGITRMRCCIAAGPLTRDPTRFRLICLSVPSALIAAEPVHRADGQRRPHLCTQVHLSVLRAALGRGRLQNPLNPKDNHIKRLIGLPGEAVQIIDGDIYIDGRIAQPSMSSRSCGCRFIVRPISRLPVCRRSKYRKDNAEAQWQQPFVNEEDSLDVWSRLPRPFRAE